MDMKYREDCDSYGNTDVNQDFLTLLTLNYIFVQKLNFNTTFSKITLFNDTF